MNIVRRARRALGRLAALPEEMMRIRQALGRLEQRQVAAWAHDIRNAEFRVFSQWGEDGIIQFLIARVPIDRPIFVEFGVENYTEANTRFLLINNQWSGLVIDGSAENIEYIKRDPIYWASNLKAVASFVTSENINGILATNGVQGDIGLLSVDIDGNDYWLWRAIGTISPRVVVCEYNSHWGPTATVSTPYDPSFDRTAAHYSKIYYGASLAALWQLGRSKGYSLVTVNVAGNNAFFVRDDVLGPLIPLTPAQAFRPAIFREFHDEAGTLTYDELDTRLRKIGHLALEDVTDNRRTTVAAICGFESK